MSRTKTAQAFALGWAISIAAGTCLRSLAQSPFVSSPRPPATPLITHNPYFSIWSDTDKLTDSDTCHWTGHPQPLAGLVRIDGKPFRIIGKEPDGVPALKQLGMELTATDTRYRFAGAGVQLNFSFFTPAFPEDMDLLSRPVTYLT
jgi:hypothetical protein